MKTKPIFACLILACLAPPALAVEIKQTVWGFDGQVVAQRFNLLSVLVDNPAADPFEGTVELHKLAGGKPVDASLVEPVYLAPYSSRWVQFYPYIKSDADAWEVAWGREKIEAAGMPETVRAHHPRRDASLPCWTSAA